MEEKKFIIKKFSELPISKNLQQVNLDKTFLPFGRLSLYPTAMSSRKSI